MRSVRTYISFCAALMLTAACAVPAHNPLPAALRTAMGAPLNCETPYAEYREQMFDIRQRGRSFQLTPHTRTLYFRPERTCSEYPTYLFSVQNQVRYMVYSHSPLCDAEVQVTIHWQYSSERRFLESFFVDRTGQAELTIDAIGQAIEMHCGDLPERIELTGTVDGGLAPLISRENPRPQKPPDRVVYTGTLFVKGLNHPELIDDSPLQRQKYVDAETLRITRENQLYRMRRQQQDRFFTSVIAVAAGFIQGVTYEFSDEGFCHFLSAEEVSRRIGVPRQNYANCHNFLNDLLDELREEAPVAYAVSNLIGMMSTTFDEALPPATTREEEVARRATAECAEGIVSEIGRLRIGEEPDERRLGEACAFGVVLGGGIGAITGPKR